MQRVQFGGAEAGLALAQPQLVQPRAPMHQDREGARCDLGIERPFIAGGDRLERLPAIGDDAGEDIEPPGRAFRVGEARDAGAQAQPLHQRHDIDAAALQHRAARQIDLVHAELVDLLPHRDTLAGQEAGTHPIGDGAQPEVEAGRLHLVLANRRIGLDIPGFDQVAQHLRRQNAAAAHRLRGKGRGGNGRRG